MAKPVGDDNDFSTRVRKRRMELGFSQSQLADLAGLSPGAIGDIESGRSKSSHRADVLASALRTTPDYLRRGGAAEPPLYERSLSQRERTLIEKYRLFSPARRRELEAFAMALPLPKRKRDADVEKKRRAA